MNVKNLRRAPGIFEVLQTGKKSQTAVMTLRPGQSSGNAMESHRRSEQVLVLLRGTLWAEVGRKKKTLKAGDSVIIRPGIKHKFTNRGETAAVSFNVYSPPEYPRGMAEILE